MTESYSVLLSVYHKENPAFFAAAIQSMMDQTVPTNDFVIVCDGPLTEELYAVLDRFDSQYPGVFNIIRLEENVGIGAAVNIGLNACKNEMVAKMDADDLSVPTRCETQLKKFADNPDLTVLGGYIEAFEQDPDAPFSVRSVPLTNEEIRHFARRRQPFNNVTVMYRRSAVLSVGGYRPLRRCEDYDMYLRLLSSNYYGENLPETLVKVRVDKSANMRRASLSTFKGIAQSRWRAFTMGYSSLFDFLYCCAGELVITICPPKLQQKIYGRFLRQDAASKTAPKD